MDPTKNLTPYDVEQIAKFARIGLTEAETETLATELNDIIDSLQEIRNMDLDGVEPTFHPIEGLVNVFREDEIVEPLPREVALENGSAVEDGAFLIPTILGGGESA